MKRSPGLLSIPTTAGTGSELSNGLIISNPGEGVKVPILAVNAMSEYAVIDPELTLGMPPGLTIATGSGRVFPRLRGLHLHSGQCHDRYAV